LSTLFSPLKGAGDDQDDLPAPMFWEGVKFSFPAEDCKIKLALWVGSQTQSVTKAVPPIEPPLNPLLIQGGEFMLCLESRRLQVSVESKTFFRK